ncbi:hypothetical protein [Mucilaginibacter psychrotolerans]|uniref:DUF4328 domain-containing protein n=1 Tax=Mucilaginibacter psychrotolerans TaxID=1524096 RepID=A0A4Y8SIM1_9SPHI|nr:hypothetical protein [Mucilaginibacter psychrotolerans]TFF38742.1 hypothetical protein E2R66_06965 [Mucilaginibacter psychrotolerans]
MIRKDAILIGIVVWVILTFLFMENNAAIDGFTAIGFPWQFYRYTGGKLAYVDQSQLGFNFSNFILDLSSLAAFIYGANIFLQRNLKKQEPNKPPYL